MAVVTIECKVIYFNLDVKESTSAQDVPAESSNVAQAGFSAEGSSAEDNPTSVDEVCVIGFKLLTIICTILMK